MSGENELDPKYHEERLVALQAMMSSPGWAYYRKWLVDTAATETQRAMADDTAHGMAKHMGAAAMSNQALTWPERMAAFHAQQIERTKSRGS